MRDIYRQLEKLLTGAELKGGIAEVTEEGLYLKQLSCRVGTLEPMSDSHNWMLGLAVSQGDNEQDLLVRCELSTSEHLPVVHGAATIDGIGRCAFRAFVSGNSIAGAWNCGSRAGQLFATVCHHAEAPKRHYTIERASECMHDWWTGTGWSNDFRQAKWFPTEPDAPAESGDEGAFAVHYASGHFEGD